jgi:NAD(P)-dependent dehydrogenase (short-subunit alcohol dehydrogenase family)
MATTPSFSVADLTVLVTGGSRGIGLMMAQGFVAAGARVIISSRTADACRGASAALQQLGTCVALPADLSGDEGQAQLVAGVREHCDRVDVLINNAGAAWGSPIDSHPLEAFDKTWSVNVKAAFGITQKLLPELRAAASPQRPGRVINIGSVDGLRVPWLDNFSYSASKAGLHMLTRHMASRLASDHVTVNAIAPGPFRTKMMNAVLGDPGTSDEVLRRVPLGRLGEPRDIAGLALFLAGPSASWITGAVIPLDGGITVLA